MKLMLLMYQLFCLNYKEGEIMAKIISFQNYLISKGIDEIKNRNFKYKDNKKEENKDNVADLYELEQMIKLIIGDDE